LQNDTQLEAAINFIKTLGEAEVNIAEFEKVCGVGIVVTELTFKILSSNVPRAKRKIT